MALVDLGHTSLSGRSQVTIGGGTFYGQRVGVPVSTGVLQSITVHIKDHTSVGPFNLHVALYDDTGNGGRPGNKLTDSYQAVVPDDNDDWITVDCSAEAYGIEDDQDYWICWGIDGNPGQVYYVNGDSEYSAYPGGELDDPWGGQSVANPSFAIYLTYDDAPPSSPSPSPSPEPQVLIAETGEFALSGVTIPVVANRQLSASEGVFSLGGVTAPLIANRRLLAVEGVFSLDGIAVPSIANRQLAAVEGTFTFGGVAVDLDRNYTLPTTRGEFVLSGVTTPIVTDRQLPTIKDVFTLSGISTPTIVDRQLPASEGIFTLSGIAVDLVHDSGAEAYVLTAENGVFSLTEITAGTIVDRQLLATKGVFAFTGITAVLKKRYVLSATKSVFALTGYIVGFDRNYVVSTDKGIFAVVGIDANYYLRSDERSVLMGLATTAKNKFITMLDSYTPSPQFDAVYDTHSVADLDIPSLSVEVETIVQIIGDSAIVQQELIDNWNIRLSIRVHTSFRLGPVDTEASTVIMDDIVRWIREHINLTNTLPNLGEQYRIFDVSAAAYNVEHESSGTVGSELIIDIHKVENYEQD